MSTDAVPPQLKAVAHEVASLLKDRKETIAVAETASNRLASTDALTLCSPQAAGGLISASLLSYPGASKIFRGGLTLYTLESRIAFAGWTQADIDAYRGPTPAVVSGLAENLRVKLGSTYCIGESCTAGPTGGNTPNRKPGYYALAVAGPKGTASREGDTGHGTDRERNMVTFAEMALKLVLEVLREEAKL